MRARDQYVLGRNTRRLLNQLAGLDTDTAVQPQQVAHHNRQLRRPVIQDQTPRMQFVMNVLRWSGDEPADDVGPNRRSDVAGRRPGLEGRLGSEAWMAEKKCNQPEDRETHLEVPETWSSRDSATSRSE
jgi:hypothetical protein